MDPAPAPVPPARAPVFAPAPVVWPPPPPLPPPAPPPAPVVWPPVPPPPPPGPPGPRPRPFTPHPVLPRRRTAPPGPPSDLPAPAAALPRHRRPRSSALIPLGIWLFLGWIIAIPLLAYLGLRLHSADFTESISPGREFRVVLPGEPAWVGEGEPPFNGPGVVARRTGGSYGTEVYRIQSERLTRPWTDPKSLDVAASRYVGQDSFSGLLLAVHPPYRDKATGCWYRDFEWRRNPRERGAGRVMATDRHLVFLTVVGPTPTLNSERVEKFFDSFRLLAD